MAVGALVCGILSIVSFCFWFLSVPLGIVAIVLGVMAKGKAQRGEAGGEGLARTGMFLGIAGLALSILMTVLAIAGLRVMGNKAQEMQRPSEQQMREVEQQEQAEEAPDTTSATPPAPEPAETP